MNTEEPKETTQTTLKQPEDPPEEPKLLEGVDADPPKPEGKGEPLANMGRGCAGFTTTLALHARAHVSVVNTLHTDLLAPTLSLSLSLFSLPLSRARVPSSV